MIQSGSYRKLVKRLRGLSEVEALTLGSRAALRALPSIMSGEAACDDRVLLALLRATISHAPALLAASSEARAAARASALSLAEISHTHAPLGAIERRALAPANGASRAASEFDGRIDAKKGVADAAADAIRACCQVYPEAEQVCFAEIDQLEAMVGAETLIDQPLWYDASPDKAAQDWLALKSLFAADPKKWAFWQEWFEGYMTGTPLDWDAQRQAALLPEEAWQLGPLLLNSQIEELRARHTTATAIMEAEAELRQASTSRHGIGGNNPPEPIEKSPAEIAEELLPVHKPLQEIKEELGSASPSASVIQDALQCLRSILKAGAEWVASKVDLAVDTIIKWGIPAIGGGYIALNPDKLEAVVAAAENWLTLLQ
jgi:hypothetical protein